MRTVRAIAFGFLKAILEVNCCSPSLISGDKASPSPNVKRIEAENSTGHYQKSQMKASIFPNAIAL